ncbi:MAG: hypothetical protein IJI58_01615 [Bacilli bacterium]|nr:hypothetical protein [Bacilli bacterium]
MNVIIANEQQNQLANLDIDIIKSINGVFAVSEIIDNFKNFFYSKMILDVTAIKDYTDVKTYDTLIKGLEADKLIFLLPEGSTLCTPRFLSQLIKIGIYNFTTNLNGIKVLVKKSNTLKDVESILKMAEPKPEVNASENVNNSVNENVNNNIDIENTPVPSAPQDIAPKADGTTVIGFKGVTESAGVTTFIYMLKKELIMTYGSEKVLAIEIGKTDFSLFNDPNMISSEETRIKEDLARNSDKNIILVDLNNCHDTSFCNDIVYLLEPSTIKLNKLVRNNKIIFSKLVDQKVVLNKSLLLTSDISDFEKESGLKVFYNMPPLDERKKNEIITDFLVRLGLLNGSTKNDSASGKIFGLFRR